jgi:uncharacterized protein (TIGR01777 family)
MRFVIAGGTGFLGTALASQLVGDGHHVVVLTRQSSNPNAQPRPGLTYAAWTPDGLSGAWARALEGADVVINLAGESIAAKRWSAAQKERIRQSRLLATHSLTTAIRGAAKAPAVFVSGSAVGYYGDRGDETLTEASTPGNDFLADVCKEWEAGAGDIAHITRLVLIRTGIVLDRRGGALPKMLPPFLMFAGGPIGSGRQYMPWIHKQDWVRLVAWTLQHEGARGPINATAPNPVRNAEFSKALGRALKRPSFMPAPGFALRIALGEMADALLLGGQRALPARATDLGFTFRFPDLNDALGDIFRKGTAGNAHLR